MGFNEYLTVIFILLGTGVMALSAMRTRKILPLVSSSQFRRGWQILFVLMIFFGAGYLAVLLLVVSGVTSFLVALTGVIFFFGALFVYIVVRVGFLTINELLQTQTSLGKARDEALAASNLKSQLLARVSHELRTPLHSILGYTEILDTAVHGSLTDKQKEINIRISANAQRLVTQVNFLLQQAQLEAGELIIKMQSMYPADLLENVESIIGPLAANKGLKLVCQIDEAVPLTLQGDIQRLQEIVTNLAGNAIKFTAEGRVSVRFCRPDNEHWAIEVSDSGPGIPSSALETIFEPFRQVDGTSTREFGGTGLGLSIVKQMTELMGGKIDVRSEIGQGSVFTVNLPILKFQEKVLG